MGAIAKILTHGIVRPVLVFPDPILKAQTSEVKQVNAHTLSVVDDLIETMHSLPRCVGLAAPQIGVLERIVVVDVSRHPKAPEKNHGLLCMINPVVRLAQGERISREGCVSVPEFTANVRRAENVAIAYLDTDGIEQVIEAHAFEAIALQHEIDHLDGKLFLDRVSSADIFKRKIR